MIALRTVITASARSKLTLTCRNIKLEMRLGLGEEWNNIKVAWLQPVEGPGPLQGRANFTIFQRNGRTLGKCWVMEAITG